MMGNWGYYGAGYGWAGFFGPIFMLLFWALIIWAIVAFVHWTTTQGSEKKASSAMAILEERYAKGEISKEEFEGKKRDLKN